MSTESNNNFHADTWIVSLLLLTLGRLFHAWLDRPTRPKLGVERFALKKYFLFTIISTNYDLNDIHFNESAMF